MANLGGHAGVTSARGDAAAFWGLSAGLEFADGLWLDGEAVVLVPIEYTTTAPRDVRLGYGGLTVRGRLPEMGTTHLSWALLVGGGNADIADGLTGVELASDNFLVIEPRIGWVRDRQSWQGTASIGYRFAVGVNDLPDPDQGTLSGVTVRVGLRAVRR